jgi:predicted AAA+ superfamily ATPase
LIRALQKIQENLIIKTKDFPIIRRQIEKLKYDKNLIALLGPVGVGKTTLLAQYMSDKSFGECLYFNAGLGYITDEGIENVVIDFYNSGGKIVIIDDIHKYNEWEAKLQVMLNKCKELKIIISGPLSIEPAFNNIRINRKNLLIVTLKELSFRIYLIFKYLTVFNKLSLNDILNNSEILSVTIANKLHNIKSDFEEYLNLGCYPSFTSGKNNLENICTIIDKTIYEDIPAVYNIKFENLATFKRFIYKTLNSNGILKVNVDKIAREFDISKPTIYIYLDIIENTGIFYPIKSHMNTTSRKPERIYFHNPNILNMLSKIYDMPTDWYILKKTFFLSNFDHIYFLNEKKFKYKNFIFNFFEEEKFTYYITDEIITENPNHIPLWLFGFLN